MMMRGIPGRIRGRATARSGAVLAAVLVAGMVPGAQASDGGRDIDVELGYACVSPSGTQQAKVRVSATLPEEGKTGEALRIGTVSTELTLPGDALAHLAEAGARSVEAQTRLTVDVAQDGHSAEAVWTGTADGPVAVPETGDLTLAVSGDTPSVTASASGELTFTAAKLTALLSAKTADGSSVGPSPQELVCTPQSGQDLELGTVGITGDGKEAVPWPSEKSEGADAVGDVRDDAAPTVEAAEEAPAGAHAPKCVGDSDDWRSLVAYITGYANVTKLKAATKFPVACVKIRQGLQGTEFRDGALHILQNSTAVVDFHGRPQLPPATATFLTFGFMPTTATMEMTQKLPGVDQDGNPEANVRSDLTATGPHPSGFTNISMEFMLRLYDVKVNGVPLDVGPNCRTAAYFPLNLRGEVVKVPGGYSGYQLVTGGPLKGEVTLPPFSGCGAEEDLDNLFTASISGEPGYVKQVQGAPCAASQETVPKENGKCTSEMEPRDIPTPAR